MENNSKSAFLRILLIHISIVVLFLIFSGLKSCFKKKKSNEIITFIEFHNTDKKASEVKSVIVNKNENVVNKSIESKPKWKPTPVNQIKKGKRINSAESNSSDNRQQMKDVINNLERSSTVSDNDVAYLNSVRNILFNKWDPSNASRNLKSPVIKLYIDKNGKILKRINVTLSGNESYDRSVFKAIESIDYLPEPPKSYRYNYVEITFSLED